MMLSQDINPKYVWGGDAISLEGNAGVWIDHCTFDLVGRMFVVSHCKLLPMCPISSKSNLGFKTPERQ